MRKWAIFICQTSLTILLFWLVFRKVDLAGILSLMTQFSFGLLLSLAAVGVFQLVLVTLRLLVLMQSMNADCSFRSSFMAVTVGAFLAQTPITVIGADVARTWALKREGIALNDAATAVVADRALGLAALVLLVAVTDAWLLLLLPDTATKATVVLLTLAGVAAFAGVMVLGSLPERLQQFRPVRWLSRVSAVIRATLSNRIYATTILTLGVMVHLLSVGLIFGLFRALGSSLTIFECLVLAPFPLLLSMLPVSIGGWGVRESALVFAFSLSGTAPETTLAVSLTFGLIIFFVSLPGGLVLLSWLGSPDAKSEIKT